jgi:hypothetical protein
MNRLSDQGVITIVSALLRRREDALQLKAHYEEKSRQADLHTEAAECLRYTQILLEHNSATLLELSEGIAPWLKDYPELSALFEQTPQSTTTA